MDEIWEESRFDPKEITDLIEDRVLVVAHTSGRARGTGIQMSQDLTHVWTLREGKAIRLNTYSTRADALEAVGLSESPFERAQSRALPIFVRSMVRIHPELLPADG